MDKAIKVDQRADDHAVSGIWIDGALYQLQGQPPVAKQGSWGDLSWLRK